ncbi:MAG: pirin family protein [Planctomycetes bacterium]|nr:pirin family protein [Planctomycetota bacterium]
MFQIRRANERGHANHGWLDTWHTFSFSDYVDPAHMSFRSLRVMNEDWVAPGQGFGKHPHRDMEIITYILEGELEHRDSLGNGSVLKAGEFQRMTAGTGIQHSEFNPSKTVPVHLYQIWLFPRAKGLAPGYDQRVFPHENGLRLVASPDGRDDSFTIQQDAKVYLAKFAGESIVHTIEPGRHAWLQVLRGAVEVGPHQLKAGDGLAVSDEQWLTIESTGESEIMLFDLS